jgi:hypothetical protein
MKYYYSIVYVNAYRDHSMVPQPLGVMHMRMTRIDIMGIIKNFPKIINNFPKKMKITPQKMKITPQKRKIVPNK